MTGEAEGEEKTDKEEEKEKTEVRTKAKRAGGHVYTLNDRRTCPPH